MTTLTSTQRLVTPEQAQQWLTQNLFDKQRALRSYQVRWLAMLMQNGHFRAGSSIAFAVYKKKHYLVNGQHTLHALIAYGQPVLLTIEDYHVTSEEGIAALYATFDRNLTRSHSDIYNAHGFAVQIGLQKAEVHALSAAMGYVISGFDETGYNTNERIGLLMKDPETRFAHMQAWQEEAKDLAACVMKSTTVIRLMLQRAAVVAVALVTLRHAPELARTFWTQVAQDDGLTIRMPAKTLLTWLFSTPAVTLRSTRYCRYVASAWNAHVEGRHLQSVRARDMSLPILLQATPHDGEQVWQYVDEAGHPVRAPVAAEE